MPTLIFVHSPLVPAWTWSFVADLAARAGFGVRTPSLTQAALDQLHPHRRILPRCAEVVAASARGCEEPILILHSAAGALAPQAATSMDPPRGIVFVDAPLPTPGASWFEGAPPALARRVHATAADGVAPRWTDWYPANMLEALLPDPTLRAQFVSDTPRLPVCFFEEAAPPAELPDSPCAYLRLSQSYEGEARAAQELGWPVRRASLDHLAMLTHPNVVAGLVLEIAGLA